MTPSTLSTKVAHDLWLEARKFKINISRPTPTTVQLQVVRPVNVQVTDGFIVLLSTKPINAYNYPSDGEQYTAISDFGEVPNTANSIGDARVVGAFFGESAKVFAWNHAAIKISFQCFFERDSSVVTANSNFHGLPLLNTQHVSYFLLL